MIRSDLSGKRFGRLLVLTESRPLKHKTTWLCKCRCGKEKIITTAHLKNKGTQSCGCLKLELHRKRMTIHGHYIGHQPTPEYISWQGLKQRCLYKNHKDYKRYGGRGIKVCKQWLKSFSVFLKDMGKRPSKNHSIDRINNDGNYTSINCRWATAKEQAQNRGKIC